MDLRQLRHFIALAEHRSFVRAADVVGLSQPAFSRSIQNLEQSLDTVLVDRSSRDLQLTGQGRVVLEHAKHLLSSSRALRNAVAQFDGLTGGELVFGSGPYPAQRLVAQALVDFVRRYPSIRIIHRIGTKEQLARWLKDEQVEFCVTDLREFTSSPLYRISPLAPRRAIFFCRPDHALVQGDSPLRLKDVLRYSVVAPELPGDARKILSRCVDQLDFVVDVVCAQFDTILQLVRGTDSIGIGTEDGLSWALEQGLVEALPITDVPFDKEELCALFGIVNRADREISAAARAMIATFQEQDSRIS